MDVKDCRLEQIFAALAGYIRQQLPNMDLEDTVLSKIRSISGSDLLPPTVEAAEVRVRWLVA